MPKYLIRLDDACHQSNWDNWDKIQQLFSKYKIKPIVGVIPSNRDQKFKYSNLSDKIFWKKVKEWESIGWVIGMHGYDHVYITNKSGLVPISNKSEFAGLSLSDQRNKIKKAWDIFCKHSIKPKIWVAPSHSFDLNTLEAIKMETEINIISDGIALNVFFKNDIFWIPQQLWSFKKLFFGSVWTICLHPNTLKEKDLINIEKMIEKFKRNITSLGEIELVKREKSMLDKLFQFIFFRILFLKKTIKSFTFTSVIKHGSKKYK